MIKVGTKQPDGSIFGMKDVKKDCEGWVDAKEYLPPDFYLCQLKTIDKSIPGWSCGKSWDGKRLNIDDEVLYWKKVD